MKYIITENKINELLSDIIEKRYKGIVFHKSPFSLIGVLPENFGSNIHHSNWSMVYEREGEPNSKKMVLWIYEDDYDYFYSLIPFEKEINDAIKHWFKRKTKLKVDIINIQ